MRKSALLGFVALVVLCAPACSMKKAVSRMSVELKKVHITNMDKSGFDATVYMQVNNPNWFGMTVSGFQYQAFVGGQELAKGETGREVLIPADGSVVAELPLVVSYGTVKDRMYEILRGRLGYRVTGEVELKTWFGRHSLSFDTEKPPEPVKGGAEDQGNGYGRP